MKMFINVKKGFAIKKYIVYVFVLFGLIAAAPKEALAVETGTALLSVNNNDVGVSIGLPESKAGKVTSLRMKLHVTAVSGTMEQPGFVFDSAVKSYIKDAAISREKDSGYIVDIILSGKKGTDIFGTEAGGRIGSLTIKSAGKDCQAKVEIMCQDKDSETPGIKYIAGGLKEEIMPLADVKPVTVTVAASGSTAKPSPSSGPDTGNKKPSPSPSPSKKPDTGGTKQPAATEPPGWTADNILYISCKSGSRRIYFNWEEKDGADGYILYEYDNKGKSYKRVKTVKDGNITSYSKKYAYGSRHWFAVRSYNTVPGGTKIYGDYSAIVGVKVPPAGVTGLSAVKSKSKVTLKWVKTYGAVGYKLYRSGEKNGKYSLVKTISKGKKVKYADRGVRSGGTYYYRIRAYVKNGNGKRYYGKYSRKLRVKM